jgi:hypothetical protein
MFFPLFLLSFLTLERFQFGVDRWNRSIYFYALSNAKPLRTFGSNALAANDAGENAWQAHTRSFLCLRPFCTVPQVWSASLSD